MDRENLENLDEESLFQIQNTISEIIKKNKGGFLVPISDPKQIAIKIFYCLKNYKLALNKANYAKKYIYRFSEKENSEKYYKELVKVIYEKN